MYQVLSETMQLFDGEPFYQCGFYFQHRGKRLHRAVWEHYNGAIPAGYHVHHKDGNRANNEISNLELLPAGKHLSLHSSTEAAKANARRTIELARPAAAAWHRSEAGRELGRRNAHYLHDHEARRLICEHCGREYETRSLSADARFCSNACKSAARRKAGLDNETRVCPVCGKTFEVNRYDKTECCSRKCAWQARKERQALRDCRCVQHDGRGLS